AQYGSLEEVIAHADELSPARRKNITEHADQARQSKELATMRRDLELDCDVSQLVLAPPDRSKLKEMFRRFEFRNLLGRVDELDAALPAAARAVDGVDIAWREGDLPLLQGKVGFAADADRVAVALDAEVVIAPRPERVEGELVVHDAKALRVEARDDTLIAAYLIEPGRATYELDDLAGEYGIELVPHTPTDEETTALVRRAAVPPQLIE